MSNDHTTSAPVHRYFPIVVNPDRTITRVYQFPSTPATPDPTSSSPVLTKDLVLNPEHNTSVRIFLPRDALYNSAKLPLVIYFHGGGFVLLSAASTIFHKFCAEMAVQVGVVVVSVDYRLAPEHRLPAAYEDGMEALHWIKTSPEEWLLKFADFSNCFLMGDSAGGNIAYHTGLRAAAAFDDLLPLKIKGLILNQPGFGGSERTESELNLADNPIVPLSVLDLMWELSLPIGADRDHEYSNPTTKKDESQLWERISSFGWRVMVIGCGGDPMVDRQLEFAKRLKGQGVEVVAHFDVGGCHGEIHEHPNKAKELFVIMKILCATNEKLIFSLYL